MVYLSENSRIGKDCILGLTRLKGMPHWSGHEMKSATTMEIGPLDVPKQPGCTYVRNRHTFAVDEHQLMLMSHLVGLALSPVHIAMVGQNQHVGDHSC